MTRGVGVASANGDDGGKEGGEGEGEGEEEWERYQDTMGPLQVMTND